mmetsp:Transcript_128/g.208  ORF Transcript_128/g.208 Transcript_128/m.208 type:complete len:364 (+) Transcript_128:65-1156(+)
MSTSNASTVFRNLNSTQLKTLAIAPKPTSLLSIAGSSYIIGKIILSERVSNVRGGRGHCTYTNLLLGLSFADLITAIAYFLTTWPIPKDNIYSDYIWGEVGNQTTCNIQGFMLQMGVFSSIMYTCSINLHFLLSIRYKWLPSQLQKIDPILNVASILLPLATAVLALAKSLYNPTLTVCYIISYPIGCGSSSSVECIRGENITFYSLLMVVIPIFLGIFFIVAAMIMIYMSVFRQDQATSRYREGGEESENRKSRKAFWLASQYVAAFCIAFIPTAISITIATILGRGVPFAWGLVRSLVSPTQGFLNAIVYSNDLRSQLSSSYCAHDDRYITQRERRQPISMGITRITGSGGSEDQKIEIGD